MFKYTATNNEKHIVSLTILSDSKAIIYCSYIDSERSVGPVWLLPSFGSPKGTKADTSYLSKFFKFCKAHGFTIEH